jgi:hypothetical protein
MPVPRRSEAGGGRRGTVSCAAVTNRPGRSGPTHPPDAGHRLGPTPVRRAGEANLFSFRYGQTASGAGPGGDQAGALLLLTEDPRRASTGVTHSRRAPQQRESTHPGAVEDRQSTPPGWFPGSCLPAATAGTWHLAPGTWHNDKTRNERNRSLTAHENRRDRRSREPPL